MLIHKVNVSSYLRDLRPQLEALFAGSGVELVVGGTYQGVAHFDATKLTRAILNIARNARDAMPQGGTFTVSTDTEGDRLVFALSDTGHGFGKEIESQLFSAFVTRGKEGGTGLGLVTVKRVAEEHGGAVTAESVQGRGATFWIALPLQPVIAPAGGSAPEHGDPSIESR